MDMKLVNPDVYFSSFFDWCFLFKVFEFGVMANIWLSQIGAA